MNRCTGVVLLLLSTILFQEAYTQTATLRGPSANVMEFEGFAEVCVTLDSTPTSEVNVTLETDDTPNGAQAGLDYESLNQVLTFPANTTILTQCVNITILQDSAVENSVEFFRVQANSTSILLSPDSVFVIIEEDNDRLTIGLEQASYTAQEGTPLEVCAVILEGSLERMSNVPFTFGAQDGTAGDMDYTLLMQTSTFQMGETRVCRSITIQEDTIAEVTETFTVTLTGNTEVDVSSDASNATVFIADNDGFTVTVSLQGPNPVTEPGTSTNLMLCASVSSSPGITVARDTVVGVNSTEGTAGTGDFQLLPDQIIIPSTEALNTLVCQNITILGDTVEEENETFTVRASVTSPNTITQPDTFTVTIVDDGDIADCGSPLVVENATENGRRNSSEGASLGTTVTYTCINGFVLNGENTSTCQADSTWSSPPTCERVVCPDLENPPNGIVSLSMGTVFESQATYTCNSGFIRSGDDTRTCEANEQWSGSEPTCVVVCPDLENPPNGTVSLSMGTVFESQATYTCNDGFVISSGDDTRTCEANGQWSGSEPTCETGIPTTPTSEAITPSASVGLSARERTIAIAVPTAVVGAILLLVVIILIIMIAVHCRKKRHSQKYVLNYHTVYGNQQTTPAPSSNRAEASSPESDREENQSPSIEDGYNTANTFKGNPPGEQNKTSIVNEDAEN